MSIPIKPYADDLETARAAFHDMMDADKVPSPDAYWVAERRVHNALCALANALEIARCASPTETDNE